MDATTEDEEDFYQGDMLQKLSSEEQAYYKRALQEMYELARLGTMKVDLSENEEAWVTTMSDSGRHHSSPHYSEERKHPTATKSSKGSKHRPAANTNDLEAEVSRPDRRIMHEDVVQELCEISSRLQEESARLKQWEADLNGREAQLIQLEEQWKTNEENAKKAIVAEVDSRISEVEMRIQKINDLTEDNKRLRSSNKVFKQCNDKLKQQITHSENTNRQCRAKNDTLQRRLINLQRKIELLSKDASPKPSKEIKEVSNPTAEKTEKTESRHKALAKSRKMYEMVAVLLGWVSDTYLQHGTSSAKQKQNQAINAPHGHDLTQHVTKECFYQILPLAASIFSDVVQLSSDIQLKLLRFIYWAMVSFEERQTDQHMHPVSFRHISQVVFSSKGIPKQAGNDGAEDKCTPVQQSFLHSTDSQLRLLSCLFLLKSLTQVDYLAHVFSVLIHEMRSDEARGHFLVYRGTQVLLFHMKPSSKGLLSHVIGALMHLVAESAYLGRFLKSISSTAWLQALMGVLMDSTVDIKLVEKTSIVLQRLSKLRYNKAMFDMLQVYGVVEELARRSSPENTFLILNLKSILQNLDSHRDAARTS